MGQEPSQIRQEIEETRAEMGDTVDALAYKTDVKTRVKESFSDRRDRLVEQIQGTTHKVGEATPDGQQVKEGAREVVGVAEETPLGLAIGGLAAAFLVGMLLPSSRIEDERVGPIADQVKETAAETAGEAGDRGRPGAGQGAAPGGGAPARARGAPGRGGEGGGKGEKGAGKQEREQAKEVGHKTVDTAKEAG